MPAKLNLTGHRYGKLVVLRQYDRTKNLKYRWVCKCDCGNETIVIGESMRIGRQVSCGCHKRRMVIERNTTHDATSGGRWTREYAAWHHMKSRCCNPNCKDYPNYGGRGITVCQEWKDSFGQFLKDMGPCPSGLTLDRKETNGNYEPSNCRWATWRQQARNQRRVNLITINGESHCVPEWSEITGISASCIYARISYGWPPERLLEPSHKRY